MKKLLTTAVMAGLLVLAAGVPATATDCSISGVITAARNGDMDGPGWVYTLVVDWDTGSQNALSHISLLLDAEGGTCTCGDFASELSWDEVVGESSESGANVVPYAGELGCDGDPSLDIGGIVLKFEPMENDLGNEPGTIGQAVFTFYSDLSPVPVDEDILSLVEKHSGDSCYGYLSGVFPALACDPVGVDAKNWGGVKGLFR